MRRLSFAVLIFSGFFFIGASCTFSSSQGAVYKSENNGNLWRSISVMSVGKRKVKLSSVDVTRIVIDPRNSNLIFLGTVANGLFASDTGGENWAQLIGKEPIADIALDSVARCTMYVLTPTQLLKTLDCAERWNILYNETRSDVFLTSVAVDPNNSSVVFLTSTAGDVFKSADGGASWNTPFHSDTLSIVRLIVDSFDSVYVYFAASDGTIYRSTNRGDAWMQIGQQITWIDRDGNPEFSSFSGLSHKNGLLYAARDGLFISKNGGQTWMRVPTLTTRDQTRIFAAASNPINDTEIYYATENTLYFTNDNGAHWRVTALPGGRGPGALSIDPNNPSTLYLGLRTISKNAGWPYNKYLQ